MLDGLRILQLEFLQASFIFLFGSRGVNSMCEGLISGQKHFRMVLKLKFLRELAYRQRNHLAEKVLFLNSTFAAVIDLLG